MNLPQELLYFAKAYAVYALCVVPLELAFPARQQGFFRPGWGRDLMFNFGQYLFWSMPIVALLTAIHYGLRQHLPAPWFAEVASWPLAVQIAAAVILCDLSIYWVHRLQHRWDFLWRFHKVHHTSRHLDWIASGREHPVDNLVTRLVENLPAMLLGVSLQAIAGFLVFRGLWAMYIHSNCRAEIPGLRLFLGSPQLHHWHHAIEKGGRVNYANLNPLMDRLFGTYYAPGRMPDSYGLPEGQRGAEDYASQIIHPLTPARSHKFLTPRRCLLVAALISIAAYSGF